jgi:hypothetical protein
MIVEHKVAEIVKALRANSWRAVNIYVHPNGVAFTNRTNWSCAGNMMGWGLDEARAVATLLSGRGIGSRLYRSKVELKDRTGLVHT